MLGEAQYVVWHQSICVFFTAAPMGKNTEHWVKSADMFPVKCTLLLCFCLLLSHPVHLGQARIQTEATQEKEGKTQRNIQTFFSNWFPAVF